MTVKALTVRQPWAWAIIHGGKDVENRIRNIAGAYRGPVAIHAGKTTVAEQAVWSFISHLAPEFAERLPYLHRGAIIGVVDLVNVHEERPYWSTKTCACESDWAEIDVYHLVLANPRPLTAPIPYRGRLGLWNLPDDIATALAAALEEVKT